MTSEGLQRRERQESRRCLWLCVVRAHDMHLPMWRIPYRGCSGGWQATAMGHVSYRYRGCGSGSGRPSGATPPDFCGGGLSRDRRRLVDPIRVKTYLRSVSCCRPGALRAQGRPGGVPSGASLWCLHTFRVASRGSCRACGGGRVMLMGGDRRPVSAVTSSAVYYISRTVCVPFIFMPPRIKCIINRNY